MSRLLACASALGALVLLNIIFFAVLSPLPTFDGDDNDMALPPASSPNFRVSS